MEKIAPRKAYHPIDILGLDESKQLEEAFAQLAALYRSVDAVLSATSSGLDLPCRRGCSACCHESVFLTPLEFLYAWHWAQMELPAAVLEGVVERGLAIYREYQALIEEIDIASHAGTDAFALVKTLRFACPMLSADGACQIYPVRELFGRLFGCSFLEEGMLYACHLVEAHLHGRALPFLRAPQIAARLNELPLTHRRQVYPYYLHHLYHPQASLHTPPFFPSPSSRNIQI